MKSKTSIRSGIRPMERFIITMESGNSSACIFMHCSIARTMDHSHSSPEQRSDSRTSETVVVRKPPSRGLSFVTCVSAPITETDKCHAAVAEDHQEPETGIRKPVAGDNCAFRRSADCEDRLTGAHSLSGNSLRYPSSCSAAQTGLLLRFTSGFIGGPNDG